jgi:hypothetical protein
MEWNGREWNSFVGIINRDDADDESKTKLSLDIDAGASYVCHTQVFNFHERSIFLA